MLSVLWDCKGVVSFSCFQGTKRLIWMSTVVSWTYWTQQLKENGQNWSIVKVQFFTMTTLHHTNLLPPAKDYKGLVGKWCYIHHIALTLHHQITIYFYLCRTSWMVKLSNDDEAVKSHLVQFLADKDQKFYECEIMKLPERWQKVIEQNGKYIIDSNSFLVLKKNIFVFFVLKQ